MAVRLVDKAGYPSSAHNLRLRWAFVSSTNRTHQTKRSPTRPTVANSTPTTEAASASEAPVQLPVVTHCPAFSPPVRAAPSLASHGSSRIRSPDVFDPVRSTLTTPSTAITTCSVLKSIFFQSSTAGP